MCSYDDGDREEFSLAELLPLLQRPGTGAARAAGTARAVAAASGQRRGRPPGQAQQQLQHRESSPEESEDAEDEEGEQEEEEEEPRRRPGRPPKQQAQRAQRAQQATLTGGRQRRPASAAAAVLGDASSACAWVQLEPSADALEASQQQGGLYEAGGAGHERHVFAWDSELCTNWSTACRVCASSTACRGGGQ